jgi:uncharacterized protein (TIGR03435 family)
MKRTVVIAAVMPLLFIRMVYAQTSRLEFEAASVKRNISTGSIFGGCHGPGDKYTPVGRCIFRRASLMRIIAQAYGFRPMLADQWLKGEPGWAKSERYDIEAKSQDEAATAEDLRLMLRNLLAERFKLAVRETTEEVAGYALLVAKGGPKVKAGDGKVRSSIGSNSGRISADNAPMERLATVLSTQLGRPVVDITGLSGHYSFTLTFAKSDDDVSAPSIFTAVQEQLGLKLESKRVPTRILVIDHVERPSEN